LKCAEGWGVIEIGKNPVTLVCVKNASKRLKRPQILKVRQFFEMLKHLPDAVPHDGHGQVVGWYLAKRYTRRRKLRAL
jgi:hypothetical protein